MQNFGNFSGRNKISKDEKDICPRCGKICKFSSYEEIGLFFQSKNSTLIEPLNRIIEKIWTIFSQVDNSEQFFTDCRFQTTGYLYYYSRTCVLRIAFCYHAFSFDEKELFADYITKIENMVGIAPGTSCDIVQKYFYYLGHDLVKNIFHIMEVFFKNMLKKLEEMDDSLRKKEEQHREKKFKEIFKPTKELEKLLKEIPSLELEILQSLKNSIKSGQGENSYNHSIDSVLEWLYGKEFKKDKSIPFKLLAAIRNSYHNNGIHRRHTIKEKLNGKIFNFEKGKPIYSPLEDILCIVEKILEEFELLISNPNIKKIDYIEDDFVEMFVNEMAQNSTETLEKDS